MPREILINQFTFMHIALKKNVDGIANKEALICPDVGGNCLNWILGHIINTRSHILSLLNEEAVWTQKDVEIYKRGSSGALTEVSATPFNKLLADFELTQARLLNGISKLDVTNKELLKTLSGLSFHESYHMGQIGILRRVIGKTGAIK